MINKIDILPADIDACLSNPCRNGGTCVERFGSHTCTCPVGYEGHNCEIGIFFIIMLVIQKYIFVLSK